MSHLPQPSVFRLGLAAAIVAGTVAILAALPAAAATGDGDNSRAEVRVRGSCGAGATSKLRLRAEDDAIELRFEVDSSGRRGAWRVVVVHERRVVWKGAVRAQGPGGSFEVRRVLPDLAGADTVTVRTWGPQGTGCRATAILAEL